MYEDFESTFDLLWPTKVKFAKRAAIGAAFVVAVVGKLLSFAFDSLKSALANVGIAAPSFLSGPTLLLAIVGLFVVLFWVAYYAQCQRAKNFFYQLKG